jgi:tetratricopeptide (TPR) repeat protein
VYPTNFFSSKNKIPLSKNSFQKPFPKENDTLEIDTIIQLAWDIAPNNFEKSIEYADSAIKLSREIKWLNGEGDALSIKGEALRYAGELKGSLENYKKALDIFNKNNNLKKLQILIAILV